MFSTAHFSAKEAGDLSTLFDVGGIIGEVLPCSASRLHSPFVWWWCRKKVPWEVTQAGSIKEKRWPLCLVFLSAMDPGRASEGDALLVLDALAQTSAGRSDGATLGVPCGWEAVVMPGAAMGELVCVTGGILAGLISDYTNGRATTCCVMLILAAPMVCITSYVPACGHWTVGTGTLMHIPVCVCVCTSLRTAQGGKRPRLRVSERDQWLPGLGGEGETRW